MSIALKSGSVVTSGAQAVSLSSLFSVSAGASNPAYLILNGLDRNEYTIGAATVTGTLSGNGAVDKFTNIDSDGRGLSAVFSYQAGSGRYFSSTYGYFDQLTYTTSTRNGDVTDLSVYTTNNLSLATTYGNNAYALAQMDSGGFAGSVCIVTQASFTGPVPTQATPASICATAQSFVGQAWNMNGCWVLASTIAAESGTSLPVDSSMIGLTGQANGEWIVAFDGSKQSGNWQSLVKAGEMIVIGTATNGHITTCVAGAGSSAQLIDNITYVNGSGAVINLANDGSKNDVTIAAAHAASQEWNGVLTADVKIYQLDTPVITPLVTNDRMLTNASQVLASVLAASDPGNKTITQFQLYDSAAGDSFTFNGSAHSAHSATSAVTVTSLSAVSLTTGASVGIDTIEVRAFNGTYWGDWQAMAVTVASSASPPTLNNQTASPTWTPGKAVSLTLAANTFSDPNGLPLTYSVAQANGLALPSWLSFTAANLSFSGLMPAATQNLSLKVTAIDSAGLSASETIAVTIAAPAPQLTVQTPNQTWIDGQHITLALPANTFTDPLGKQLSYSAFQIGGTSLTNWLSFNPNTDTFSGTVPQNASGTATIEVDARNSAGLTTTERFNVTLAHSAGAVSLVGVATPLTHGFELLHGLLHG